MENFYDIKAGSKGKRASFEELSCQIFRREFYSNDKSFQRYRGDGGDGGIEAVYICNNLPEIGLQSKYWESNSFGSSEITQLTHSIETAIKNYPTIKSYIITIPFNLTGKVAEGKRGKSQTEKYTEWKNKVERKKSISITLWDATSLSDLLHKHDISGGLFKFWFDKGCFSLEQYQRFTEEVIAQAGKRYTPELNIEVPLYKVLYSFSEKKQFFQDRNEIIKLLEQYKDNNTFKEYLKLEYSVVNTQLYKLLVQLRNSLYDKNKSQLTSINHKLQNFKDIISEKEKNELYRLKKQNGDHFSDTQGYRQFMAEYMCDFPCALLDKYRELIKDLGKIIDYINSDVVKAFFSQFMIITGPAGIGKTHSIVDYMINSSNNANYVFFGEDFVYQEPWIVFRNKLGLSNTVTKDELFQILSINAEINNCIGIIFIDAINESSDYTKWRKWLPVLIHNIKSYPNLKLCISCRDTFNSEFEDEFMNQLIVKHNGFIGNEYLAINSFCTFYKLIPPSYPIFNSEFGNPLFLHLLCETLQQEDAKEFPKGQIGINQIFQKFSLIKNKKISKLCDIDEEDNVFNKVFIQVTEKMLETRNRYLLYSEFKKIVEEIYPSSTFSTSLTSNLEKESVITKLKINNETRIRFTYDRFTDFFIAKNICEGNYEDYLNDEIFCNENLSVIEMLAIVLPEIIGNFEVLDIEYRKNFIISFIKSLSWRNSESITDKTIFYVRKLLGNQDFSLEIMNVLLSLSVIPSHRLNADFMKNLFFYNSMCDRDRFFNYYLVNDYDNKNSAWQLINRACFFQFDNYSQESLSLWGKVLCLFCSSSDRRIRDQSSKGLTRLLQYDYSLCKLLYESFKKINDEYIMERLSQAIYSSLLLSRNQYNIENFALYVIENDLLKVYNNVVIHDSLRLIIELAYLKNIKFLTREKYIEIISTTSNNIFEKVDENFYQTLIKKEQFSSSNINFVGHWYTDFQRYILGNKIDIFDLKASFISVDDIYKWFVVKLSELGYPGRQDGAWDFDKYIIFTYGNGRGKPIYAERLSKKYYWILLHQLIGLLRNTCNLKKRQYYYEQESQLPILFSIDLRDIDLTDLRYCSKKIYPKLTLQNIKIDIDKTVKNWILDSEDFYSETFTTNQLKDENNTYWVALNFAYTTRIQTSKDKYPYREICLLLSSSFITTNDLNKLSKTELHNLVSGNVFDNVTQDYRIFLGEIQNSRSYNEFKERNRIRETEYRNDEINIIPSSFELLRGREWEYDCSYESDDLLMPSKFIIDKLHLSWDGESGWEDEKNNLCVFSQTIDNHLGLFIRKDLLNKILDAENKIIFRVYKEKLYVPIEYGYNSSMHNKRILLSYDGNSYEYLVNYDDNNNFREAEN